MYQNVKQRGVQVFYRRKYYTVKNEFVKTFNDHFNKTNLSNQLKHGARFIGRWMKDNGDGTTEIFAIWEYDSYEDYVEIEKNVRADKEHVQRVVEWYEQNGGREFVLTELILEVRNEVLLSTVD